MLAWSIGGDVFGWQAMAVKPPFAAAAVPGRDVFFVLLAGDAQMDVDVDQAGATTLPVQSMTLTSGPVSKRCPMAAMEPSAAICRSATSSTPSVRPIRESSSLRLRPSAARRHWQRSGEKGAGRYGAQPADTTQRPGANREGLTIGRYFTTPGSIRSTRWSGSCGMPGSATASKISFEQEDVEFPASWSQNATNIVAQKYFRGQLGSPEREWSVKQMITRVAGTIAGWGRERGYFATDEDGDAFEAELTYILLHQMAAFNSPVWFNVGWHPVGDPKMQASACFILSVEDNMESILEWNTKEGVIFRGGSGSGINLSKIRGSMEPLSRGGTASGPVSFMRGADAWAGSIKSGGGTRRAAKMVVLDVDHPDIREFIWCKAKEEDKAAALRDAGFDMSIDGDGFHSIQYQNANNSVRLTDEFMQAVENDEDWHLIARTTGKPIGEPIPARELMSEIAEAAWRCADPGVQYDTTINQWHTCPNSGRINASNPCSEYMHVDDSACNLASLNLMKFRQADGTLDVESFEHAVDTVLSGPGDHRRPVELSHREDRRERAGLPSARSGLRQPGRVPDVKRHALRLRRGSGAPPPPSRR